MQVNHSLHNYRLIMVAPFFLLAVLSTSHFAHSASLYKWIDEEGNVVYQDTPPPSDVNYEEQEITEPVSSLESSLRDSINAAALESPVSLYSIVDCDACDLVRLYLEKNSVPFSEKDIQDNLSLQQELRDQTGQLKVPTVLIGELVIDGYSKSAIKKGLIDNGYPIDEIESGGLVGADNEEKEETIIEGLTEKELDELTRSFEEQLQQENANEIEPVSDIQFESQ